MVSTLAKQRDRLVQSFAKFNVESRKYLGLEAYKECVGEDEDEPTVDSTQPLDTEFDTPWDPVDLPDINPALPRPETFIIAMPSALPERSAHRPSVARLLNMEMELRRGHANDCLGSMRRTIGQEAFEYKKVLRPATDKTHQTRARTSIQTLHRGLILQARIYKRTREAMLKLGVMLDLDLDEIKSIYKPLTAADIHVTSAVNDPNIPGSTRTTLSWIWTLHQGIQTDDNHLTECGFLIQYRLTLTLTSLVVYRVHWLRARAQLHRWQEEVILTQNEMHWVSNNFTYRQNQWSTWQSIHPDLTPGHHAYAERQKAMWAEMRQEACRLFTDTWADFNTDPTVFTLAYD